MPASKKAALLSALIFPGVGQLFLKRYVLGLAMLLPAGACLFYIVKHLWAFASNLSAQIQSGAISPDLFNLLPLVTEYSQSSVGTTSGYLSWLLIAIWVLSIVEALRPSKG